MKSKSRNIAERGLGDVVSSKPTLVKAAEFEARRQAAAEAAQAVVTAAPAPVFLVRAPRGEAEAREMFDSMFEAA